MSSDDQNTEPYRLLTFRERAIIVKLLHPAFPGRDGLLQQLDSVTASQIDSNGGLILKSGVSVPADVKGRVPTEGECSDSDGVKVHLLLHVVDGFMVELEIFKEDASTVQSPIDPDTLLVFAPFVAGPQ